MLEIFIDLSAKLCGEKKLSRSLAAEYLVILQAANSFTELLENYRKISSEKPENIIAEIERKLLVNNDFRILIKRIIMLWYLGTDAGINGELKGENHYFHYEALIWKTIRAHPPGLTGGYYGYWAYPPEN